MTNQEKIKILKEQYGITYAFIAGKIGIYKQNLYKYMLPADAEQYRDLTIQQAEKLDDYLKQYFCLE